MTNPQKIIRKIIGDDVSKSLEVFECFICGKDMTYPTMRHGQKICSSCAEKADMAEYKKGRKW